ncbi:MAG: hypothetical protein KGI97_07465 [Alphaproteobacteria bacterium]|nr:hypothetical protein [Alphaproteobacteria bacterium]
MNATELRGRMSWLGETLAVQRNNIQKILLRLKDIGMRAGANMALHRKFLNLLEQVAEDRNKELGILNDIEDMEKRHALMRKRKLLRRAGDAPLPQPANDLAPEPEEEKPERSGLLKWVVLWMLFANKDQSLKKQSLTMD